MGLHLSRLGTYLFYTDEANKLLPTYLGTYLTSRQFLAHCSNLAYALAIYIYTRFKDDKPAIDQIVFCTLSRSLFPIFSLAFATF
jgi:hypothetical protein